MACYRAMHPSNRQIALTADGTHGPLPHAPGLVSSVKYTFYRTPHAVPLQATMIVADAATCLEVSGRGELLEPSDGVHAIGSGSRFAIAAARALMQVPGLQPFDIAQRAMRIAAEKCVYTNSNFIWEVIDAEGQLQSGSSSSSGQQQAAAVGG